MAEAIGTAFVDLFLNDSPYQQGIKHAESASNAMVTGLTQKFRQLALVAATAFSTHAIYAYMKEATMLTARLETMNIVLGMIGKNAGYTTGSMKDYVQQVKQMGITTSAAQDSITKMAQANLDLSQSSKLARVAQDAAVIGNTDSSAAFQRMIWGIKSGQTEILRTMGLNVQFEASYAKYAVTLNKTAGALTEQEKVTARMNAVLAEGIKIQGAYEAAMATTGKLINSLPRFFEEVKEKAGELFSPALGVAVRALMEGLKGLGDVLEKMIKSGDMAVWAKNIADGLKVFLTGIKDFGSVVVETAKFLWDFRVALMAVGVAFGSFMAMSAIVSGIMALGSVIGSATLAVQGLAVGFTIAETAELAFGITSVKVNAMLSTTNIVLASIAVALAIATAAWMLYGNEAEKSVENAIKKSEEDMVRFNSKLANIKFGVVDPNENTEYEKQLKAMEDTGAKFTEKEKKRLKERVAGYYEGSKLLSELSAQEVKLWQQWRAEADETKKRLLGITLADLLAQKNAIKAAQDKADKEATDAETQRKTNEAKALKDQKDLDKKSLDTAIGANTLAALQTRNKAEEANEKRTSDSILNQKAEANKLMLAEMKQRGDAEQAILIATRDVAVAAAEDEAKAKIAQANMAFKHAEAVDKQAAANKAITAVAGKSDPGGEAATALLKRTTDLNLAIAAANEEKNRKILDSNTQTSIAMLGLAEKDLNTMLGYYKVIDQYSKESTDTQIKLINLKYQKEIDAAQRLADKKLVPVGEDYFVPEQYEKEVKAAKDAADKIVVITKARGEESNKVVSDAKKSLLSEELSYWNTIKDYSQEAFSIQIQLFKEEYNAFSKTTKDKISEEEFLNAKRIKLTQDNASAKLSIEKEYIKLMQGEYSAAYTEVSEKELWQMALVQAQKITGFQDQATAERIYTKLVIEAAYQRMNAKATELEGIRGMEEQAKAARASADALLLQMDTTRLGADAAGLKALQSKTDKAKTFLDSIKEIDVGLSSISFGDKMADGINSVVSALQNVNDIYEKQAKLVDLINDKKAKAAAEKDPVVKAKAMAELDQLEADSLQARIGGYRKLAGAASEYFEEGSNARKALHSIEMTLAAIEMAMTLKKVATELYLTFTKTSGIATTTAATTASVAPVVAAEGAKAAAAGTHAVSVAAGAGPYIGIAMAIAMIAFLASIGVSMGANTGSTTIAPPAYGQNTTVLGGANNQGSESITKSWELLQDTYDMENTKLTGIYNEMKNLNQNITGIIREVIRSDIGNVPFGADFGTAQNGIGSALGTAIKWNWLMPIFDSILGNNFLGGIVDRVTSAIFGSTSVSATGTGLYIGNQGKNVSSYTDIKTEKKGSLFGLIGGGTDYSTVYGAINADLVNLFSGPNGIYPELKKSLSDVAEKLGGDIHEITEYTFADVKLNLMGMTAEERSKEISEYVSKIGDEMAKSAFRPLINLYQQVGEGAFETVQRLVVEKEIVLKALEMTGKAFSGTAMEAVALSESLIRIAGGLDKLQEAASTYYDKFFTDEEKQIDRHRSLLGIVEELNKSLPVLNFALSATRQGYRAQVEAMEEAMYAGAEGADKAYVALMKASSIADEYYSALEDAADEQERLVEGLKDQSATISQWISDMNLSPLAPANSMEAMRFEYDRLKGLAAGANATSSDTSNFLNYAKEYLSYMKNYGGDYKAIYEGVITDAEGLKTGIDWQIDIANRQLAALNQIVVNTGTSASVLTTSSGQIIAGQSWTSDAYPGQTFGIDSAARAGVAYMSNLGIPLIYGGTNNEWFNANDTSDNYTWEAGLNMVQQNYPSTKFAMGGDHMGGWRMVGETGPELEFTPPSRIYSNAQTREMLKRLDEGGLNEQEREVHIHIHNEMDGREMSETVAKYIPRNGNLSAAIKTAAVN